MMLMTEDDSDESSPSSCDAFCAQKSVIVLSTPAKNAPFELSESDSSISVSAGVSSGRATTAAAFPGVSTVSAVAAARFAPAGFAAAGVGLRSFFLRVGFASLGDANVTSRRLRSRCFSCDAAIAGFASPASGLIAAPPLPPPPAPSPPSFGSAFLRHRGLRVSFFFWRAAASEGACSAPRIARSSPTEIALSSANASEAARSASIIDDCFFGTLFFFILPAAAAAILIFSLPRPRPRPRSCSSRPRPQRCVPPTARRDRTHF